MLAANDLMLEEFAGYARPVAHGSRAMIDHYCQNIRQITKITRYIVLDTDNTIERGAWRPALRLVNALYDKYGFQPIRRSTAIVG
jgi:hypothetical protein